VGRDALLETEGLSKAFGGVRALDRVNFALPEGELRAVIGPNGAGKTTFFNLVSGLLKPTAGRIRFRGEDITGLPAHRLARRGIARTLQITSIFPGMTVRENLWVAAQRRRRFYNPLLPASRMADVRERVDEVLRLLHLDHLADEPVGNLSHGHQRLIEVGIAISAEPRLLLLDEPTSGLSAKESSEVASFIKDLKRFCTIILVEHKMDVVMGIADRVTVFAEGRVFAEGSPGEISNNKAVQEIYLGSGHAQGR
jgi:branched-chain amino acid transport system ATP-binding protein